MRTWVSQLRKGLVEFAVLAALGQGEAYGYELLRRVNAVDGLSLQESTVYPLLARLTRDKLLIVRTVPSSSGPPRRYYRLTAAGRRRLDDMVAHWHDVQAAVAQLLSGAQP